MWTADSMPLAPDPGEPARPDAFLLLSFGGPEGPDDVLPFLTNVTRGRGVPAQRLTQVAEHYQHFGGVSPLNAQNRALLAAIGADLTAHGVDLPLYWGNRNWHPMLADTMARMRDDGVRRAVAFVTSAYGSYSACRQYLQDIATARAAAGPGAPVVDKLRHYHDHPGYVLPYADAVRTALSTVDTQDVRLVFTGHSVPMSMARSSGPAGGRYEAQLRETAALVAATAAPDLAWDLAWQSRSGPPHAPWLEPDINDHLADVATAGVTDVVVCPIGFSSDHLEVVWDLDIEAAATAEKLGLGFARAATPGTDPRYVTMVRQLIAERYDSGPKLGLGTLPVWDICPEHCCLSTSQEAS